jgi:GT2 family glycosyltransferase
MLDIPPMPSENAELSISIVTYKTDPAVLEEVLKSIANSTISSKVYVVDNSPLDDLQPVAGKYHVTYLHTKRNIGFGRGHNLALELIGHTSKYHLILNPDISFMPSVLEELYGFLEMNPEVGWVMPNILYPDGSRQSLCKRLPTPWDLFSRRFLTGYGLDLPSINQGRFECDDLDLTRPRPIPYLSGCFALVRTSLIHAVGRFDERFFMYLEDTDLVRRIGEISLTVFYPYASVSHVHGRGSYRNLKLLAHHLRSTIQYFYKWGWFIDSERARINNSIASDKLGLTIPNKSDEWALG